MLNIDSIVLDKDIKNDKDSLENEFGKNVSLCNFDFVNDGFVNGKFVLDGKKDYIEIKTDWEDNTSGKLIANGMTLEFYGTVLEAGSAYGVYPPHANIINSLFPILSINTYDGEWSPVRFYKDGETFRFNFGSWQLENPWNLPDYSIANMIFANVFSEEKLPYVTFTLNHLDNDTYQANLYLNGKLKSTGLIKKDYMDNFWSAWAPKLGVIRIGELGMSNGVVGTGAHLGKGEFDILRLYARCLDDTEVQENYDIWKLYREN